MFHTERVCKCLFEILEGFPHDEDLVCQPIFYCNGVNIGSILSPHNVGLMKPGKLWKKKRLDLLIL
jgi:hypothetical protein